MTIGPENPTFIKIINIASLPLLSISETNIPTKIRADTAKIVAKANKNIIYLSMDFLSLSLFFE